MYIKTMDNRKVLVKRLEQLTRIKAVYTRMPECAFVVGDFKVERYGTLVIGDEADAEVVETLLTPVPDSRIRFYNSHWSPLESIRPFQMPTDERTDPQRAAERAGGALIIFRVHNMSMTSLSVRGG